MITLVYGKTGEKFEGSIIHADKAWELFLPDCVGDIQDTWKSDSELFKNWLWRQLGKNMGFMRSKKDVNVKVIIPETTKAGLEFIVRTCSFWSDEVFLMSTPSGREIKKNLWHPPVVNLIDIPGKSTLLGKISSDHHGAFHSLISPILGSAKSNIRTYLIPKGKTFARFHSHSIREEFYYVVKGKGSARVGGHKVAIVEGDLISKPTGPDMPTQLLADMGSELRILDVEIWPDIDKRSKDLVHYPDHGELDLFGEGWDTMIPDEAASGLEDSMANYESGYQRHLDGSWESKEIPGFPARRKGRKKSSR